MIRIKKFILLLLIAAGLLYVFKNPLLQAAADYLIIKDNPAPSDVVIVLGGETEGERTERAVDLYNRGVTGRLLFSDGTSLSWRTMAVDEMVALAEKLKVPKRDIYKEERSRSTYENALYTKEILQKNHWKTAVVVTTDWHTRRSKFIFDKVYQGTGIKLTYAGAKDKRYDSLQNWWLDSEKQQVVLTEWARLIVYWIKY